MFQVDDTIDEQYRLVRLIGEGGQGTVFEAEDLEIGAPVAIKVLKPEVAAKPEWVMRLRREARAMGMLADTAAVQIFALNRSKSGHLYIVMEMLRGQDLDHCMRRFEGRYGFVPVPTMIDILSPIVATLDVAHQRGIVHRDVKPANIFVLDVVARGRVRLLDFGMVKDLAAVTPLTKEGIVLGSPSYIAPEGWRGNSSIITAAADVYSMGALVFRILSGHAPFQSDQLLDVARMVTRGPRPSLVAERPHLPRAIDPWIARALAIAPEDRFKSVRELWDELVPILTPSKGS
ncbi:MAG TPA: serine/threonine-protein kinase [Polyangium sp.]|nr:serine/threonine-protein kinase [Polyangium sp.]